MVKTKKMLEAEKTIGRPLEEAVPEALAKHGTLEAAGNALGINPNTLYSWMPRLGISKKYILAKNK